MRCAITDISTIRYVWMTYMLLSYCGMVFPHDQLAVLVISVAARRFCFHICLLFCLSARLLNKRLMNRCQQFFCIGGAWPEKIWIRFWCQCTSLSVIGSGFKKGHCGWHLCCPSDSRFLWFCVCVCKIAMVQSPGHIPKTQCSQKPIKTHQVQLF